MRTPWSTTGTRPGGAGPGRPWLVRGGCALATAVLAASALPAHAAPAAGSTVQVSVGVGGAPPNGTSWVTGLSADGRYVVFGSYADNLVPGDTNGQPDMFVRDLRTERTERVSVGNGGAQAAGPSYEGVISGNGRYVAFTSADTGLAPDGLSDARALYVRDRWTGRTERLATGATSERDENGREPQQPSISWDGRYIAFAAVGGVFVTDRWKGTTRLVSVGAATAPGSVISTAPRISADGNTVVFISHWDLPGTEARRAQRTVATPGGPGADASGEAAERTAGATGRAGASSDADGGAGILKPNYLPLYVHDMRTGRTRGASIGLNGELTGVPTAGGSISPDGRYAVFTAVVPETPPNPRGGNLAVFVRDLERGVTTQVNGDVATAGHGVLTAGGRWVYFTSTEDDLVPGDTNEVDDVFRRDLWTGRTERVSLASDGTQGAEPSWTPFVDALGTTAVFVSKGLAAPKSNGYAEVFARRLPPL
ncbi:hypothetical protein ACF061_38390 [Streptomyces sp. NPDC015220]|uniref:TolB family protein n=1 Tax=Streptomyces sp. NPDC015220 TaxID=3364947 RepID=UPI0036F5C4BD